MTTENPLAGILPALSRLNNWARVPWSEQLDMHDMPARIYAWKHMAIAAAIKLGMAQLRIVAVERSCKTCKGTGTYVRYDWNDEYNVEYERCRRCNATGKVILRFVESRIEGVKWHTPRPIWDLGIFAEDAWEKIAAATDWEPEQPGVPLNRLELVALINQVERVIPLAQPRFGGATQYTLHLGEIPGCWVCRRSIASESVDVTCCGDRVKKSVPVGHGHKIYRSSVGLCWESSICQRCDDTDAWKCVSPSWPVDLHRPDEREQYPRWHERVPLPEIARDPQVVEWLARRQIYFGRYFPGELAWAPSGDLVRVLAADQREYMVEVIDRHGWTGTWEGREIREWVGPFHEEKMRLAELRPTARNSYVPQFDWSELRV